MFKGVRVAKSILFTERSCAVEIKNTWLILKSHFIFYYFAEMLYIVAKCFNKFYLFIIKEFANEEIISQIVGVSGVCDQMVTGCCKKRKIMVYLHYRTKKAFSKI